jgi:hypothetical protein
LKFGMQGSPPWNSFLFFILFFESSSSLVPSLDFLFMVFKKLFCFFFSSSFFRVFFYQIFLSFFSSFSYFFIRDFSFKFLLFPFEKKNNKFLSFWTMEFSSISNSFSNSILFDVMMNYCMAWIKEVIMFFQCECIACNSLRLQLIRDGRKGPCNLWTKLPLIKMS